MPDPIPSLPPTPEFLRAAEELGIVFEEGDVERLGRFLHIMLETNKVHNLTAITEPGQAWEKHVLDALTLMPVIAGVEGEQGGHEGEVGTTPEGGVEAAPPAPAGEPVRVIDIGSGGGVPGIPLAIVLPTVRFTLLEATGKKAEYLHGVVRDLELTNVEVLNVRAEEAGQDRAKWRERFDVAVVRAVGHLAIIAELASPFVRPQGVVLAVKGAKAEQELAEAKKAIEMLKCHHEVTIPTPTGRIVVLRKDARTPKPYPRKVGEPKRAPLGMGENRK